MFKKLHFQLTLLCTGITAVIMVVMSLCYLYVSETGLYKNQFHSFKNDMNTISTNLEQQTIISMEWLSKMESQGNYLFFVLDNETPYLYNQLKAADGSSNQDNLLRESLQAYRELETLSVEASDQALSSYVNISYHEEFEFTSPSTGENYYSGVINIMRGSSVLRVVVLSSLNSLEHQILQQRIRFAVIDFCAVFLLAIFAFFFAGKLLKPIIKNQKEQTTFIASASHELRTPLAVILSSAECCTDSSPERQEILLNNIKKEGQRMSSLIEDMLTLSQTDSHRFSVSPRPVELDTLLVNAFEAFEPMAKQQELTLSITLPDRSLPPCTCDPKRIAQVISILLHNAVSYTPQGGAAALALEFNKGHFYITVADNGTGISDEEKEKIFKRFYRAEKARSAKGHFGLGLSIAYEIMKAHHGNLTVADAPGGGCLFTVELPQKP